MKTQISANGRLSHMCCFGIVSSIGLVLLLAVPVFSQLPTGTILGVVKDASGGTVPDAKVRVTNSDTNDVRTVSTGGDGAFRVPALRPGHYNVTVEKEGFKIETQTSLILDVEQELVVNTTMQVGNTSQQVTVTGEETMVNTTTSSLGGLVNDEKMADLPLNGRNFVDLSLMQPGVTNNTNFGSSNAQGGNLGTWFSSNGAPVRSNNTTLDGAPMINIYGTTAGAIGTTLGVDGIKEYKVVTTGFGAEYGMSMGSQIVIVTKGGTNQFHGNVFEYLRNNDLDARNFFDYSYVTTGDRLPQFQRNNFGGSFGGPIKKDKTFFYAVYEALRQNFGATIIDNVFPANCHVLTNNPCTSPAGGTVPAVMAPLLALFPSPNLPNNQFTYSPVNPSHVNYGQIRVDHNFSPADSVFGRYTVQDSGTLTALAYPQTQSATGGRDQFLTLSENHIFSGALLNTVRVSYSRSNISIGFGPNNQVLTGPQFSFVPGLQMGAISVGSTTTFPNTNPTGLIQNLFTASDDVYYTKGRHAFKFGVLLNRFENYDIDSTQKYGTLQFGSQATFLRAFPSSEGALEPGSDENRETRFYTAGFYAQDDWRVTSRLTLNLGLRYEITTIPNDRLGRNYAVRNITTDAVSTPGPIFRNPSYKNFGPRVGFAWDVTGRGKTSVRAAFGEYYDIASEGYSVYSAAQGTPPISAQSSVTPAAGTVLALPFVFSAPGTSLHTNQYDLQQPHLLQWNLTVEQQLSPSMALTVSYVGTRGIHLWNGQEGNPCIPTSITNGIPSWLNSTSIDCPVSPLNPANKVNGRENPAWGAINYETTLSDSNYNSLQALFTKRVSHGLEVQGAFTWGKIIDDQQGQHGSSECVTSGGSNGVYPEDAKRFDSGPACFDVGNNIRVSVLYHLPKIQQDNAIARSVLDGWWVGSLVSWQTGFPFTPMDNTWRSLSDHLIGFGGSGETDHATLGTATVAPGQTGPDGTVNTTKNTFIPYNPATITTGNPQQWFNPLMFTPGPVGFLGTAGRDILRGPHLSDLDFSVNKDTAAHFLGEAGVVQFRVEFFNILNHANFGMPNGLTYAGTITDKSQFVESPLSTAGTITNTVTTARQIQLSLKVIF